MDDVFGLPVTARLIETNGIRLHAVEAGTGPLVLLLHGFPDFWYGWRHQLPALAAFGHRAVALDMRGYHRSDKPSGVPAYRLDALSDDVAGAIEALGERDAVVVGHDWGGIVAWHTALRHAPRVRRLVILNAPPPLPLLANPVPPDQVLRSWYVGAFQLPVVPELAMRAGGFAALKRVLRAETAEALTEVDFARYEAAWREPGALTAMINYYRALAWFGPLNAALALGKQRGYAGPTLILWGERDVALSASLSEPAPDRVPDARVVRYPDARHWVHWDEAEDVNRELTAFLSG